ncbi:MAG: DUF192 domain-containing protein [Burkholderiaceae bacterium]
MNSLLAKLVFLASAFWACAAHAQEMPRVQLSAGIHLIKAEVAANDADRQRGLMFREKLAESEGMLFIFEQYAQHCMWMKNTPLPLSVAFIDDQGVIVNIEDMKPQALDSHCAKKPAVFALEMNQGWFKRRGIKPGMKIGGVAELIKPRK